MRKLKTLKPGQRGLAALMLLTLWVPLVACGSDPTVAPATTTAAQTTTAAIATTTSAAASNPTVISTVTPQPATAAAPTIAPTTTTAATTTAAPTATVAPTATAKPATTTAAAPLTIGNSYPSGPAPTAAPPSGGSVEVELQVPDEFRKGVFANRRTLNLPPGFSASVYAQLQGGLRFITTSPDGVIFASEMSGGRIVLLKDKGQTADRVVFAEGLNGPHGLAFYQTGGTTYLYVAEQTRVVRFPYKPGQQKAESKETIVGNLPNGGGHSTRTIIFGPDGKMYVAAGSSCNVCVESDPKRAAVTQYNPDGTGEKIFASGLRNGVGLAVNPATGEIWETENSRDNLGDNMPPDEINILKDGGNYGWPFCISNGVFDSNFGQKNQAFCDTTVKPALPIQAHSAPLGISFYTGKQFPAEYQGNAFVGLHGSWNRSQKTGYKVIRIQVQNGRPTTYEDFATGWLVGGNNWGRPVMPMTAPDGSLLVTDDSTNAIYKISYTGNR